MTAIKLGFGDRVRDHDAELLGVGRRGASEYKANVPIGLTDRPFGRIASIVRRKRQAVASYRDRQRIKVPAAVLNVGRNRRA